MAKLPRVAQKIFAGSAETDDTAVFGTMKTGSPQYTSDIKTLMSNPAFLQGWKASVEESFAPFMEETTGVQKVITQQLAYVLAEGIPEWDSETTYYLGAIAKEIDNGVMRVYYSKIDENTNNPLSDQDSWESMFDSSLGYAFRNLSNSTAISNCITKIPQDIKLEIDSNGKCWLKAGSKCYKPNGTVINIEKDIAVGRTSTGQEFIGVSADGSRIAMNVQPSKCYSGTTAPTGFSGFGLWLDTNSMTYKFSTDGGSTWTDVDYSLPIALVTMKNVAGEVASIDQVFNFWGKIGDAVFLKPGIDFMYANGFNADGSYNSLKLTTSKIIVRELTQAEKNLGIVHIVCYGAGSFGFGTGYQIVKNSSERKSQTAGGVAYYYVEDENLTYVFNNSTPKPLVYLGYIDVPNNKLYIRKPIKLPDEQDVAMLARDNLYTGNNLYQKRLTIPAQGESVLLQKLFNASQDVAPSSNEIGFIFLNSSTNYATNHDGVNCWIAGQRTTDGHINTTVNARKYIDGVEYTSQIRPTVLNNGTIVCYGSTVQDINGNIITNLTGDEILTAKWFNTKVQVVSTLPASPDANVYYFVTNG